MPARVATLRQEFDAGQRWVRSGAEVPAVDGAGGPAPQMAATRRWSWPTRRCEAMARGGIYDQLGGGFARYSVDAALGGAALREDAVRQRPAARGLHPLVAAHRASAGGGWSPRPSAGCCVRCVRRRAGSPPAWTRTPSMITVTFREGAFYVWNLDQLVAELGAEDAAWAAEAFGVTAAGTFEEGGSTLRLIGRSGSRAAGRRTGRLLAARDAADPSGPRRQGGGRLERLADRVAGAVGDGLRPT